MAANVFNIAKGAFADRARLTAANDALIWIIAKSAGLESQATLQDYDDVAAIFAAANDEADFAGYARVTATGVTVTVDDTNNRVDVDAADPSWSPTAAQAIGLVLLVHDGDTTAGNDANLTPLFMDDAIAMTTPTSGSVTYVVATGGMLRAS